MEGEYLCGNVRYNKHLYCLVVQAGFYRDLVECRLRSSNPGREEFFFACYTWNRLVCKHGVLSQLIHAYSNNVMFIVLIEVYEKMNYRSLS